MATLLLAPFGRTKTCIFRRFLTLRRYSAAPVLEAARRVQQLRQQRADDTRLRNFYGWCAGCEAYGSIF